MKCEHEYVNLHNDKHICEKCSLEFVPAREPSDTARHFRVIEKALGYVMPYFTGSRKDAEASLAALRASLPNNTQEAK